MEQDEIPTRESCDLTDPRQMFWWMMIALPGLKGAPALLPISYYQEVSERIEACGGMVICPNCEYEKPPRIKWVPPVDGYVSTFGAQGKWVDVNEPEPERDRAREAVKKLRPELRRRIREILEEEDEGGES